LNQEDAKKSFGSYIIAPAGTYSILKIKDNNLLYKKANLIC